MTQPLPSNRQRLAARRRRELFLRCFAFALIAVMVVGAVMVARAPSGPGVLRTERLDTLRGAGDFAGARTEVERLRGEWAKGDERANERLDAERARIDALERAVAVRVDAIHAQ